MMVAYHPEMADLVEEILKDCARTCLGESVHGPELLRLVQESCKEKQR